MKKLLALRRRGRFGAKGTKSGVVGQVMEQVSKICAKQKSIMYKFSTTT